MKDFDSDTLDALETGDALTVGAVEFLISPALRVWGGYGELTLEGNTFNGIGDRGLVSVTGGALGGAEQNITLALSGVEPDIVAAFNAADMRRVPVVIWRLIFNKAGTTLLNASIFARGRVDQLPIKDMPGGTSTLEAMIEGAARGLGRRSGRMRTDADQRLIKPTDGSMKSVSHAGDKSLYWGGQQPISASGAGGVVLTGPPPPVYDPYDTN